MGAEISWNPGVDERVSQVVGEFLAARFESMREMDLSSEANFFYVVLHRAPKPGERSVIIGRESPIIEFGFGGPPHSPEDWPMVTLASLLQTAVDSLLPAIGN
jgi:hypothetical protein